MPAGGGAVGGARGGGGSQRSLAGRYGGAPIWWWPPQSPPPPHTHTHHHHHTHTLRAGLSQVPGAGSTTFATSLPVAVPGSRAFATIAAGEYHYCALDPGGSAWCWGGWMGGSPSACQWVAVWGGAGLTASVTVELAVGWTPAGRHTAGRDWWCCCGSGGGGKWWLWRWWWCCCCCCLMLLLPPVRARPSASRI